MRRQILTCSGAAMLLVLAAGCASSRNAAGPGTPRDGDSASRSGLPDSVRVTPAFEPIVAAAIAQSTRPVAESMSLPAPESLPEALATPIAKDTDAGRLAHTRLDEVLPRLTADASGPNKPASEPSETALRHYIAGREQLLAGHAPEAIDDLKRATQADPSAGEPWRELGEAQLAAGLNSDALVSFQRAVENGIEEPRVLELLGRAALERGETGPAAGLLARALHAGPEEIDPLLPAVIQVQLAKALAQEGYFRAAREAIDLAFASRQPLSSSTRYSSEFGAIYRRQGEIWREAGDLSLRLGEYGDALEAFARCATLPVMDGVSITPRLVFAAAKSGRPAAGAVFILEGLAARNGLTTPEDAELLRYLARVRSVRRGLADAIARYREELAGKEGGLSATVSRSLTHLQAAVLGPDQRLDLLRSHLAVDPSDIHGIVALLDARESASDALSEAVRIVGKSPDAAPFVAEALFRSRHRLTPEQLAERGDDDARLLSAYYATGRGLPRAGLDFLGQINDQASPHVALATVQLACASGEPARATAALRMLATAETPAAHRAYAKALLLFQDPAAARMEMQGALESKEVPAPQRMADLLLAAEIAGQLGVFDQAEILLLEAHRLDPRDERPLTQLIDLYAGPRADQARFNQLVRELRDDHEDGRGIRTLRAREFLRRSMAAPAEREALSLLEDEPSDTAALRLLLATWDEVFRIDASAADRARAWVDARLDRRGHAPTYLMAMTAVEIGAGTPQAAEPRLREALEATRHPDISRVLERLLRDHLDRGAEANELALARLEGRERTPAESFELAQVYSAMGRELDAVNAAKGALEAADTLLPEQSAFLLELTAALGRQAVDGDQPESQEVAAWMYQRLIDRGVKLRPDDHEVRIVLVSREGSVADVLAVAKRTGDEYPTIGQASYIRGMRALFIAQRAGDAVEFASRAAAELGTPGADFVFEWFRLLTTAGTTRDVRAFIESAEAAGQLSPLLVRIGGESFAGNARAEAAYLLGNFNSSNNRREAADAAYELALEYDPNHPWACNNLGYSLADRNVELERAAELLERAHAALPAETAITDSLGWLRYKQGLLEDQNRPDGSLQKGAVSLLREAVETDHGSQDPTILDHYGDALWLAGRAAEASHYWQLAQNYSMRLLRPAGGAETGQLSDSAAAEYRDILSRSFTKRSLVGSGEWVPVAPQAANPRPAPPPTAAPATGESPKNSAQPGTPTSSPAASS